MLRLGWRAQCLESSQNDKLFKDAEEMEALCQSAVRKRFEANVR